MCLSEVIVLVGCSQLWGAHGGQEDGSCCSSVWGNCVSCLICVGPELRFFVRRISALNLWAISCKHKHTWRVCTCTHRHTHTINVHNCVCICWEQGWADEFRYSQRREERVGFSTAGITYSCKPLCRWWKPNSSPERTLNAPTAKPSLQPQLLLFQLFL